VPAFSDFIVMWDGVTFDLTGAANTPVFNSGTTLQLPLCGATTVGAALTFGILMHSACSPAINWQVDAFTPSSASFIFNWPTGPDGGNFFIASSGVAYDNTCGNVCSRGRFQRNRRSSRTGHARAARHRDRRHRLLAPWRRSSARGIVRPLAR